MSNTFYKDDYLRKLNSFMMKHLEGKKNVNILEFGVRKGVSTQMFLDMCKNNESKLYSVDVDDYSNLFNDPNWTFINTRDDNFNEIEKKIPKESGELTAYFQK